MPISQNSSPLVKHELLNAKKPVENPIYSEDAIQLTERQALQLKRDLLTRVITSETEQAIENNVITCLRSPELSSKFPFLSYFFNHYILTFPFLSHTDIDSFLLKLETFQDELKKAGLSDDSDRSDHTKRQLTLLRVQKILVLLFNNAIPLKVDNLDKAQNMQQNESIRLEKKLSNGINMKKVSSNNSTNSDGKLIGLGEGYLVDIVGARQVDVKGHFRTTNHTTFIIMTIKQGTNDPIYSFKRYDDFKSLLKSIRRKFPLLELPSLPPKVKDGPSPNGLLRESDRLTLRSVFRRLLGFKEVVGLPDIYQFLTSDQDQLSDVDVLDMANRKMHMDQLALDQKKFTAYLSEKTKLYNQNWSKCKTELLNPGGLNEFEKMLSTIPDINNIPPHYLAAVEWGKLNLASFLYTFFCTTDDSARLYQALVSSHRIIPYRTLATILKYTNPTSMVKAVIDLLLAQPFGSTSLMQRLLTASLTDQAKDSQKQIEVIEAQLMNESLCERVKNFAYFPQKRSPTSQLSPEISDFERLTVIINDHDIQPELTPDSIMKFWNARQWMDKYVAGESPTVSLGPDGFPEYQEFRFLEGLHQLYVLTTRKRDAENISELMFQGVTGELMKDLLSIFYGPLAQVYKDADVSDFMTNVGLFIDDLIVVIQKVNSGEVDESMSCGQLQRFLDLATKYQQFFYHFVHSVYKSNSNQLFQNLLKWADKLLTAVRDGVIEGDMDMQALIDGNITKPMTPGLKSDLESLNQFTLNRKRRQFNNLKKKISSAQTDGTGLENEFSALELDEDEDSKDFGFGQVTLDDVRELQDLDRINNSVSEDGGDDKGKLQKFTDMQSKINANPSEPMLIYLNDSTSPQSIATDQTVKTNTNEDTGAGEEIIQKIQKFIEKKKVLNISQEPYPTNITTLPSLVQPFCDVVRVKLR